MTKTNDIPFADIVRRCTELQRQGAFTYVKWTCSGCGGRQTYIEADAFPTEAACSACGAVTNIVERGGGFLLAVPTDTFEQAQSVADYINTGARADGIEAQVVVVNLEKTGLSLDDAVRACVGAADRQSDAAAVIAEDEPETRCH